MSRRVVLLIVLHATLTAETIPSASEGCVNVIENSRHLDVLQCLSVPI